MNLRNLVMATRNMSKPGYHFQVGDDFGAECKVISKTERRLEIGNKQKVLNIFPMSDSTPLPTNRLYRIVDK